MTELAKTFPVLKTAAALLAAAALVVLLGTVAPARAASPSDGRFITTELPNSPAGIQMQWFVDASTRLPLGAEELGAHFDKAFLAQPSATPARTNLFLQKGSTLDAHLEGRPNPFGHQRPTAMDGAFMEPSGRNRWQPVANGKRSKTAQTGRSATGGNPRQPFRSAW